MSELLRIIALWLIVSVVIMLALTGLLYLTGRTGRRSPDGPRMVDFDSKPPGRDDPLIDELDDVNEPAITHMVDRDSPPIERLLAGVTMPCGLEPLTLPSDDTDDRLVFVTEETGAKLIAVSVVDELERMGLDVEPLSFNEARAWRDGFELAVTIHVHPNRVIRDRRAAFPGAPRDSIVVEFSRA